MPVMIKSNEATELCITRGQEGIVRGWDESRGPSGQRILETLFVELTKPPRDIQINDLPLNVVPIPRTTTHITALLHDDTLLSINRDQVIVLPNFSMTDYCSNPTKNPNLVHLNYGKNHRSYYIALSRGNEAEHTVIVQGFDETKITRGIKGYLRQEFRELELLDEITTLRVKKLLPPQVSGMYRNQLLRTYTLWKKSRKEPLHFHPKLRYDPKVDSLVTEHIAYMDWHPTIEEEIKKGKRKPTTDLDERPAKRSRKDKPTQRTVDPKTLAKPASHNSNALSPIGLIWDSEHWSCGYDALFMPMTHLLRSHPEKWTNILNSFSSLMGLWANCMKDGSATPEIPRNNVRAILNAHDPIKFPTGPVGLRLDDLLTAVSNTASYGTGKTYCESCGYNEDGTTDTFGVYMSIFRTNGLTAQYPTGPSLTQWLAHHFDRHTKCCPNCRSRGTETRMRRVTQLISIPSLMLVAIDLATLKLNERLTFKTDTMSKTLQIRGPIYHSELASHFTSMVIDDNGLAWYHDGMTTGCRCALLGRFSAMDKLGLHNRGNYKLSAAIYAEIF
ncbi:hypothetical protein B0H13DRAFT_1637199 [Mycena leptocephala]|nr:hypothetical protein B0H13DRAFT_1637199 [Mycena leptocephala]